LVLPVFLAHIGLDDVSGVVELQEQRMSSHLKGGGAIDMTDANIVSKWFAYMFRPLFYDVRNAMGLMASFDNMVWLIAVFYALRRLWRVKKKDRTMRLGFQMWFYILSTFCITLPLAFELSNLGLALRQKTMVLPFIFLFIVHINYVYNMMKNKMTPKIST
jgi:L-asparagine transporter-like permease